MSGEPSVLTWLPVLGGLALKSLILFLIAGAALLAGRRASASARHLVCLLTLAALLALPVLSLALPGWRLAVLSAPAIASAASDSVSDGGSETHPAASGGPPGAGGRRVSDVADGPISSPLPAGEGGEERAGRGPSAPPRPFPWLIALLTLWLGGALLAALRPLLGLWGIARLSQTSAAVLDAPTLALTAECASALGISQMPALRQANAPVPMTWGWLCPVVLVPAEASPWSSDLLRAVLLHELAHIRRHDWLSHRLADVVCALYWFHPLAWLTARRLRMESEIACDDLVLTSGVAAPDYARHLLDVARALRPALVPTAAIAMARTARIEGRLTMILDTTRPRRALTRRFLLTALGVGAAALVPLAMLRPAARAQAAPPASVAPRRQQRASAEPKDANGYMRRVLLLKYYGAGWSATHPDAMRRAAQIKPLHTAAMYGGWAEGYGGIQSGNTERFLQRAQALEPNNPQWPDRLGDLYSLGMIHASPTVARLQAQKALTQHELAATLLGEGPGTPQGMAANAFDAGEYDKARRYAGELLHRNEAAVGRAGGFPQDDERHHAHLVLGLLALRGGDTAGAEAHLLAMGRVSGSPTLDTFGPNMRLAKDLLAAGRRDAVLAYLNECGRFWKYPQLAEWRSDVAQGKMPHFGTNLYY